MQLSVDLWRLYREDRERICATIRGRAGDSAEDCVQDAFLVAARLLPAFRGDASLRTWVTAIARRAARNLSRRDRSVAACDMTHWQPLDAESALVAERRADAAREALLSLSDKHRHALYMTAAGYTDTEVATDAACPAATVRTRRLHGASKLAALLLSEPG